MTTTDNNSINNIKTLNLKDNQNVLFIPQEDKISNNQDIIKNLEVDNTNDNVLFIAQDDPIKSKKENSDDENITDFEDTAAGEEEGALAQNLNGIKYESNSDELSSIDETTIANEETSLNEESNDNNLIKSTYQESPLINIYTPSLKIMSNIGQIDENNIIDNIANVNANDNDSNSNLTYYITGRDSKLVTIDQNGVVSLTNSGKDAVYNETFQDDIDTLIYTVNVTDGINTNSEDIIVNITRTNNNAPVLEIVERNQITEDIITTNDTVLKVLGKDVDDGDTLSYSLSGANSSLASIDTNGNITLTQAGVDAVNNDNLELSTLDLTVEVNDGIHTTTQDISLDVTRVNDNAPTIQVSNKAILTEESVSVGDTLATITGNDLDNNTLSYSLSGANASLASIDTNGNITLTQAGVDAINNDSLNLNKLDLIVEVNDGIHTTDQDISLDVTRVNENAPTFDTQAGSTITEESINVGDTVATFSASDLDANDTITFDFKAGDNDDGYFAINPNTGEVTLTQDGVDAINSDTGTDIEQFQFQIVASDSANPANTTTSSVIDVNITRVNDNAPTINLHDYATVTSNQNENDTVIQIKSTDLDDNDTISYSITSGNDDNYFKITNDEIVLTDIAQTYLSDTNNSFNITLEITATDLGGHTSTKDITITSTTPDATGTFSNNTLLFDNTDITNQTNIDGGAGIDSLVFKDDSSIDLSAISLKTTNMEVIDLNVNGSFDVNLKLQDLVNLTDSGNDLKVIGGTDDSLNLTNETNSTWTQGSDITESGITYHQYSNSSDDTVTLKVDENINTNII